METLLRHHVGQNPKSSISTLCSSLSLNGFASFVRDFLRYRWHGMDGRDKHIHILHNLHIFLYLHGELSIHPYTAPLPQLVGAVFGAGSATGSISINNAIFLDENNISHLCKMFLLYIYGKNCSIGTDISTDSTVKVTKSFLKANSRLHHACQAIFHKSRFQDMRRAFADTKMTGCALLLEVFPTDRPRRSDRIFLFCMPSYLPSLLQIPLAWEMSLGVAPAVTRPATKKRRLDESKSGDDGAEVSTSDCFF